jgi:hypothetical protein
VPTTGGEGDASGLASQNPGRKERCIVDSTARPCSRRQGIAADGGRREAGVARLWWGRRGEAEESGEKEEGERRKGKESERVV